MASKYSSTYHEDTPSYLRLCEKDQRKPGSCEQPLSCQDLHMCRDYIFQNKCIKFEAEGTCAHCHSLFTLQNRKFVEKRAGLSLSDDEIFEKIARLLYKSESGSSKKPPSLHLSFFDTGDQEQTSTMTTAHGSSAVSPKKSFLKASFSMGNPHTPSPTQSPKSGGSSRFPAFMDSPLTFLKNLTTRSSDLHSTTQDQSKTKGKMLSSTSSYSTSKAGTAEYPTNSSRLSSSVDNTHKKHTTISSGDHTYRGTDEFEASAGSGTHLIYLFDGYSEPTQLSYMHGPVSQRLIDEENCQVLSSGYCRFMSNSEERRIKGKVKSLLPTPLRRDHVQQSDDEFNFYNSTSAAERFFEQNQKEYAIISIPCNVSLHIQIINETPADYRHGSHSAKPMLSSRHSLAPHQLPTPPSDDKYHMHHTGSSIAVIFGDISQVPVDLMVCVTTSKTILNSVLNKAGKSIVNQYVCLRDTQEHIVLPGGSTSAKNILFEPWILDVRSMDPRAAQNSLSSYVKFCIDEAHRLNMRSISFPSIGTGELGLDVQKVCQAMFQTAIGCLQRYQMDVCFVIYPSRGDAHSQRPEMVFQNYMANLRGQSQVTSGGASSRTQLTKSISVGTERSEITHRDTKGKSLATVSTQPNNTEYHRKITESLKKLIIRKRFDLSLVQQSFRNQINLLIDACLTYKVVPSIDLSTRELLLRGDIHSCLQCFANLRDPAAICEYTLDPQAVTQFDEKKLNTFISLKIDEARGNKEQDISIEDDEQNHFRIDLLGLEIEIVSRGPPVRLFSNPLNENSKISPPNSWSSSLLRIRTQEIPSSDFRDLEIVPTFHQTMSQSEWHIERVESIENWPLYVHFAQIKSKTKEIAFHGCSLSSVQSIIHYGLHALSGDQFRTSIQITRDSMYSHTTNSRRATDGRYYMFAVLLKEKAFDTDMIKLLHTEADLALPTHLIVYRNARERE